VFVVPLRRPIRNSIAKKKTDAPIIKMARTASAATKEATWSAPAEDWDAADGGFALSQKKTQGDPNSSPRTATREAAGWLLLSQKEGKDAPVTEWPDTVVNVAAATPDLPSPSKNMKKTATTPDTARSTPNGPEIPSAYTKTIEGAFGVGADLYKDILNVSRESSPRDVRIAYFRRGREVLAEGDVRQYSNEANTVGGSVSSTNKLKFQAVSMAYEIVGNAVWLEEYEARFEDENKRLVAALARSAPSSPVLRRSRSSSEGPRRRSRSQGVRWSEEVEELVFEQHPTEMPASKRGSKRGQRKPKKRVVVDTGELKRHLENLDRQAERHFVADFLDDFEASIDELMSLGSSKGDTPKKSPRSSGFNKTPTKSNTRPVQPPEPAATKTETYRSFEEDELPVKRLSYDFRLPPEVVLADEAADAARIRSDDSVSTLSASIVDRRIANKPSKEEPQLERVTEEDRSSGSESGKMKLYADTSLATEEFARDFDLGCDLDVWCGTDDDAYPSKQVQEQEGINERGIFGSEQDAAQSTASAKASASETPEFHLFLMTYLQTLAEDLHNWGASLQDLDVANSGTQMMEAMMISEEDLEGMMGILRTEMDRDNVEFAE
jgi:hypothetical protein